jgi:hypothetical protein
MKKIAFAIIFISVIIAAITASKIPIDWIDFSLSIVTLLIGITLQRKANKKELQDGEGVEFSFDKFKQQVEELKGKVLEYSKSVGEENINNIDDEMKDIMPDVDNYRNAMIAELGIARYTEIISVYAKAERLINRGISAIIDEYFEDAEKCFIDSLNLLDYTISKIREESK